LKLAEEPHFGDVELKTKGGSLYTYSELIEVRCPNLPRDLPLSKLEALILLEFLYTNTLRFHDKEISSLSAVGIFSLQIGLVSLYNLIASYFAVSITMKTFCPISEFAKDAE